MKHTFKITAIILLIISVITTKAQDTILTKYGVKIVGKIIDVTPTDITYKMFEDGDWTKYTIPKLDVVKIKYEDGSKVTLNEVVIAKPEIVSSNNSTHNEYDGMSMTNKGRMDANSYYRSYGGAYVGTMLTAGLADPIIGLVPAILCSSTPPKEWNLDYPNPDLMNNADYKNAYTKRAYKIKKHKTWLGYGIGAAIYTALFITLISIASGEDSNSHTIVF